MRSLPLVVFGSLLVAAAHGSSPAILWPADQFALRDGQSALELMPSEEFEKMFQNKKVVIFHKRSLSMEDVSYPSRPLPYLSSVEAVALQGVKSAHRLLTSLTSSESLKVVTLDDSLSMADLDEKIKQTMDASPGFAAILLGSAAHRSRRAADDKGACEARPDAQKCMGYVASVKKNGAAGGTCSISCSEEGKMTITAEGVTLQVTSSDGGYSLSVEGNWRIDADSVWAPDSFSYSCSELRVVSKAPKSTDSVSFVGLQLWPSPKGAKTFPDSFDCATWFTTTMWAGVVVVLFYLFILFGAILFLLDVKTNDRFDDPKGKTITVNVSE